MIITAIVCALLLQTLGATAKDKDDRGDSDTNQKNGRSLGSNKEEAK